jgi:hypothetical protein
MRPIRAKHTPDRPTVGTAKANIGDISHNISTGNDAATAKAISNDHIDIGNVKATESIHHIFIKACRKDT